MPRRSATLLASTFLLIGLLAAAFLLPVPYSEMSPGPTYNTLGEQNGKPVIQVSGGPRTYDTSGHLNMTTVQVSTADFRMNLAEMLVGWVSRDTDVVPKATLYPDNQTEQQSEQMNAEEFASSTDTATAAALTQLGYKVGSEVVVGTVVEGAPAQGRLHAGDVITAVDGTAVTDPDKVAPLVVRHKPGQDVVFTVVPNGKPASAAKRVPVPTVKSPQTGKAMVGIVPSTEHTFPFKVDINLAEVGGPSAGLMFSLGIIDKLQPTDLTGGRFVAGTGTMDADGKVGPIGGISMKTIAARNAGARYFFTPSANCAEAAANTPAGLRLIKVDTLKQALDDLARIRSGRTSELPACKG
ncbi:YlbL family protein [Phaeacidiphilus oryzae]|jgi:PDZ domain-containing protein|uniref:YlbL family protein n=1 Tax=Phaeacidiphilus oryzae TaxID=348818 RepID=UPI000567E023|nr:PDZ domain-containing protein [Phaeacidiphilus oryzae]